MTAELLTATVDLKLEQTYLQGLVENYKIELTLPQPLQPEQFYSDQHQQIKMAMNDLLDKHGHYDLILLNSHITDPELNSYFITEIAIASYIPQHTLTAIHQELTHRWMAREMMFISMNKLKQLHQSKDVLGTLSSWRSDLDLLGVQGQTSQIRSNPDISRAVIDRMKAIKDGTYQPTRLTGINSLDHLCPAEEGDLITIGACPGVGKSWLMTQIAYHLSDVPGILFSLEMTDHRLALRLYSHETGINTRDLQSATIELTDPRLDQAVQRFNDSKYKICDTPGMSVHDIESHIVSNPGLEYIIIDHGILMDHSGSRESNKSDQIGDTTAALKRLAKKYKLKVILLWQLLTKEISKRGGSGKPFKSDLRGSSRIDEDSDSIILLWSPSDYADQIPYRQVMISTDHLLVALVEKSRHGETGMALIDFRPEQGRLTEWDSMTRQPDPPPGPYTEPNYRKIGGTGMADF